MRPKFDVFIIALTAI